MTRGRDHHAGHRFATWNKSGRDNPGLGRNWRRNSTKHCLRGELIGPVHFRRGRHQRRQGNDRADRDRQAGQPFEKEAVTKQNHVGELRDDSQLGETSSNSGKEAWLKPTIWIDWWIPSWRIFPPAASFPPATMF